MGQAEFPKFLEKNLPRDLKEADFFVFLVPTRRCPTKIKVRDHGWGLRGNSPLLDWNKGTGVRKATCTPDCTGGGRCCAIRFRRSRKNHSRRSPTPDGRPRECAGVLTTDVLTWARRKSARSSKKNSRAKQEEY